MQAVVARGLGLRRGYATMPSAAQAARTASTPLAVRIRRANAKTPIVPRRVVMRHKKGSKRPQPMDLNPSEQALYDRRRALGMAIGPNGHEDMSPQDWIEQHRATASRVRGIVGDPEDPQVVGQTVYLPNIIFRLVRNNTPVGQPYNPYEATFRVPLSITKTDVRSYLHSIYGVQTTYIRTDVYRAPLRRGMDGAWNKTDSHRTYKRAVVGLVEPFYYPQATHDMSTPDRVAREKWVQDTFAVEMMKTFQKQEMLRMTRSGSKDWKWRHGTVAQRGHILKTIMERRNNRDMGIDQAAKDLRAAREVGDSFLSV
jgi:large subunit ribosomal protein L23